jgi:hypothetical protein
MPSASVSHCRWQTRPSAPKKKSSPHFHAFGERKPLPLTAFL